MEIHQYWTVHRQTQRTTTPSFAKKWRLHYNHQRRGLTTSQQNGFKQVGRSNHRSHNGLRKDLAKRTMAKPLDPLLGHHITVGVVGTTQIFSTALWDLANSRLVQSLMLSSNLFFCLPCLLPPLLCLARWLWPNLMNKRHVHTTSVCTSLRWSEGLRVVRLPARTSSLVTWSLYEKRSILR